MGNSLSYNIDNVRNNVDNVSNNHINTTNNESLLKVIDEIASNYIFKQNVVDMLRFSDSKYRDNFVILTCRILDKKLTNLDIASLKERIVNTNSNPKNTSHGELVYFSELEKMKPLLENEEEKKEALLIISKFYVRIFTLFSSIVSVVDPQYTYKDENGEDAYFYLKDYDDLKMIDAATNKLKLYHLENPLSLVKRRLFILKNKLEQQDDNGDYLVLNPGEELCSMNIPENDEGVMKLSNEIGIKELDNLYFDLYDEETSEWSGRSKEMEEQYKKDVNLFFQIFTGKKKKPSNVTTFADIELLDFHNLPRCKNNDYFEDLLVSKNDVLFQKYLSKIEEIQHGTRSYKKQLLFILKSMFLKNERTGEEDGSVEVEYTIHPELDMKKLSEKQKQVQSCIVQMYTNCEKNFIEALLLYEKMYENQYGELVNAQFKNVSFVDNKNDNNNPVGNKYSEQNENNMILNGNLLLNDKIKMPNINSNRFKLSNQPNIQNSSVSSIPPVENSLSETSSQTDATMPPLPPPPPPTPTEQSSSAPPQISVPTDSAIQPPPAASEPAAAPLNPPSQPTPVSTNSPVETPPPVVSEPVAPVTPPLPATQVSTNSTVETPPATVPTPTNSTVESSPPVVSEPVAPVTPPLPATQVSTNSTVETTPVSYPEDSEEQPNPTATTESNSDENAVEQLPPQSEDVSQPDNNNNKEELEIPHQELQESQESPNDLQKEILDESKKNKISLSNHPVNNLKNNSSNSSIIEQGEKAKKSLLSLLS